MAKFSQNMWNDIIGFLRVSNPELVRSWFQRLTPGDLENGVLTVRAQNSTQVRYLQNYCQRAFAEGVQAATGRLMAVQFEASSDSNGQEEHGALEPELTFDGTTGLSLNREYTFDNFITGPSNRLAHAAAVAVTEEPGRSYNPLFIHGDVGLGKTHLLQAICHQTMQRDPDARILYISCETFSNHFFEAVEKGALNLFRFRYRHVDTLVIDDIQFLAERERSQEEFFHTFNTLHQTQRQIVLSADCSPADIPSLEVRLISRFNSGLVTIIDKPCLETRMAILRKKARLRGLELPEDVIRLVAGQSIANIRELEGSLARIDALGRTLGKPIDYELAQEALGLDQQTRYATIPDILDVVGKRYCLKQSDLQGKRRSQSVTRPRQICMYLARQMTNLSLAEIGGYLGGRDHSTVLHADRLVRSRMESDTDFNQEIEDLTIKVARRTRLP